MRALWTVLAIVVCDYIGVSMMRVTLPFYAKALGGKARAAFFTLIHVMCIFCGIRLTPAFGRGLWSAPSRQPTGWGRSSGR